MICHPKATTAPVKLEDYRTHTDPPGISGELVEGRFRYDAFVLGKKKNAIATHRATKLTLTPTNAAGATGKTKFTAVTGHGYPRTRYAGRVAGRDHRPPKSDRQSAQFRRLGQRRRRQCVPVLWRYYCPGGSGYSKGQRGVSRRIPRPAAGKWRLMGMMSPERSVRPCMLQYRLYDHPRTGTGIPTGGLRCSRRKYWVLLRKTT